MIPLQTIRLITANRRDCRDCEHSSVLTWSDAATVLCHRERKHGRDASYIRVCPDKCHDDAKWFTKRVSAIKTERA